MTAAVVGMELRLRARTVLAAAAGLIGLTALVGALFPAIGDSIGRLELPQGVGDLIGGGDYSTIGGWLRTEITSIYGPLVVLGMAIVAASATTAGDEEHRILALLLAHPVSRTRLLLAKAAAVGLMLLGLAIAVLTGMLVGVALAGGGVTVGNLAAAALQLLALAVAVGALALAVGACTGRRGLATGVPAAVAMAMFLVNGLAPSVAGVAWLRYLTLFHYYAGRDPLTTGPDLGGLAVLAAVSVGLTAAAVVGFARRDLRG